MSDSNKRKRQVASKLTDPNNVGKVGIRACREAREKEACQRERDAQEVNSNLSHTSTQPPGSPV
jgi:hypothetical protein